MNKVDLNKIRGVSIKKIKETKPEKLEEVIEKYFNKLRNRAEREVPEYDDFKTVEIIFKNPDKELFASDFCIKVINPPKGVENQKTLRGIVISAYKNPFPYKAERLIAAGTKEEILKKLKSPEFLKKVSDAAKSLSESLRDV